MKELNLTTESTQFLGESKLHDHQAQKTGLKNKSRKPSQAELARTLDGNTTIKSAGLRLCGPCG